MKSTLREVAATLPDIPSDVLDQAIDWLVKLRSGTPETTGQTPLATRIATWRATHPSHEMAWQELHAGEEEFRRLAPLPLSPTQLADALDNVRDGRKLHQSRRKALQLLTLGTAGVAVGVLALHYSSALDSFGDLGADYASGVGERRAVTLSDGTRVNLNTDSAFDIRYSDERRLLLLRHGEIFVDTGKDLAAARHRPFWVQTSQAGLQALGTQFTVQQDEQRTRLAVTGGRVAIYAAGKLQAVAQPGEIFFIDADGGVTQQTATSATIDPTGWIDNALIVKQMPLGQFVHELGRYRRGWLHCDPAVADLLVSGVFQIGDTDLALASLARALPVDVEYRTRYWVTLSPARRPS